MALWIVTGLAAMVLYFTYRYQQESAEQVELHRCVGALTREPEAAHGGSAWAENLPVPESGAILYLAFKSPLSAL